MGEDNDSNTFLLESLCSNAQQDLSLAAAALLLWIEELPSAEKDRCDEFVTLSLGVSWRDVSIFDAARMKKPTDEILREAPERYPPIALLYHALDRQNSPRNDTSIHLSGSSIHRETSLLRKSKELQHFYNIVVGEDFVGNSEENDRTAQIFCTIMEKIEKLINSGTSKPNEVYSKLLGYLEGRVKEMLKEHSKRLKDLKKKRKGGYPRDNEITLLDAFEGVCIEQSDMNFIKDHPLKSVSAMVKRSEFYVK